MQRVHAVLTISRGPWLGVPGGGRARAGTHHTVRGAWRGPWAGTQHSSRGGTRTRGRTRTRGASHRGVWRWHCPGSPAPRWAAGTWQKGDKRVAEEEIIFIKVVGCIHFNSLNLEKTFTNIWTAKLHMRLHSTVLFFWQRMNSLHRNVGEFCQTPVRWRHISPAALHQITRCAQMHCQLQGLPLHWRLTCGNAVKDAPEPILLARFSLRPWKGVSLNI